MERAHAKIEKGWIQLANPWLERRWNAFMGTTTELLRLPEGRDCLAQKSPEFHLEMDGRSIAAQDLGDIGWTDTSDRHGAAVWEGSALIPPGKSWRAPSTTLYWCRGIQETAIHTELQAFHQAWEARKAAEGGLHPSRN